MNARSSARGAAGVPAAARRDDDAPASGPAPSQPDAKRAGLAPTHQPATTQPATTQPATNPPVPRDAYHGRGGAYVMREGKRVPAAEAGDQQSTTTNHSEGA